MKKIKEIMKGCLFYKIVSSVFVFTMLLSIFMLSGCDWGIIKGKETLESTTLNINNMMSNETKETKTIPYKIYNEKGELDSHIDSGGVHDFAQFMHDYDGNYQQYWSENEPVGNIFISDSGITNSIDPTDDVFVLTTNLTVDDNWMDRGTNWFHFKDYLAEDNWVAYGYNSDIALDDVIYYLESRLEWQGWSAYFIDYRWECDLTKPTIDYNALVSVNVDNQPSIEEILSNITAVDDTDGIVPVVVESATYVSGTMEVGTYSIEISATDLAGNKATATIVVERWDRTAPVIMGTAEYSLNYDHDVSISTIENALTIQDNVDRGLTLNKVSDNFTGNEKKLGNYQVVYNATDTSGNTSANYTINISVENKGTPVISGPFEIMVGNDRLLTLEEFKSKISVIDGYDGEIANYLVEGFDDYTRTGKIVGTNTIIVRATNSGNNEAMSEFKIIVLDKRVPNILYGDYFIMIKKGESFSPDMLINHVAKMLSVPVETIVDIEGNYDIQTCGNYVLTACKSDNTKEQIRLSVVEEYGKTNTNKFDKDKFFSCDNYFSNMFKPAEWNVCHYATLVVLIVVVVVFIVILIKPKRKNNDYDQRKYY